MFHSLEFHKWISFSYLKKLRKNYFYRMNNHFSCIKLISRFFLPPKLLWFCFFSPGVKLTGQIKSSSFFPPKFLPTQISHMKKMWWSCLKPTENFFLNRIKKHFSQHFFFHSKFHTWKKKKKKNLLIFIYLHLINNWGKKIGDFFVQSFFFPCMNYKNYPGVTNRENNNSVVAFLDISCLTCCMFVGPQETTAGAF